MSWRARAGTRFDTEKRPVHTARGTLTGASCWRADGTPVGLGGGYARPGIRFWPDRHTPPSPA